MRTFTKGVVGNRKVWRALSTAAAAALFGSATAVASAQSISYTGGTYAQNFDALPSTAVSFSDQAAGIYHLADAPVANRPALNGWYFTDVPPAGGSAAVNFVVSDGTSTTGATYSLGTANSTDRALGALAASGEASIFGAWFVNGTGQTVREFTIAYTGEQWRRGTAAGNQLSFLYSLDATSITSGTFTAVPALHFQTPVLTPLGVSNGNSGTYRRDKLATVNGIAWAPGASLFIHWRDVDNANPDDTLGIDDFTFRAGVFPGRDVVWSAATNTSWDTATSNFTLAGSPTAFAENDKVTFADVGVGPVNVVGSVKPSAVRIENAAGTYTFGGGSIDGGAGVTKVNAGTVAFTAANGFAGGLNVNGGIVSFSNDNQLGIAAGSVTVDGGTLKATAPVTSTRTITVGAAGATLDLGANAATLGAVAGAGAANLVTTADLTLTGPYNVTGPTALSGGRLVLAQPGGASTIVAGTAPGAIKGAIVMANGIRLNVNGGLFDGAGGKIQVRSTGSSIVSAGGQGAVTDVNIPIELNPLNVAAPFVTAISADASNALNVNRPISGNGDLHVAPNPNANGGSGLVVLNAVNTYTGATVINNQLAVDGNGTLHGRVRVGVDNALPRGTALTFGTGANADVGSLDLNGKTLTVGSLATNLGAGRRANGIVNSEGSANLVIAGSATTVYDSTIGTLSPEFRSPYATGQLNANISLTLGETHAGSLKLTRGSDYAGGTFINNGTLVVAAPGGSSATGAGLVSVGAPNAGGGAPTLAGADAAVAGGVFVFSNGAVAPGTGAPGTPGALTLAGGATFLSGSTFAWDLLGASGSTPGADFDQLVVGGDLSVQGGAKIGLAFAAGLAPDPANAFWNSRHQWKVVDFTGAGVMTGEFDVANPSYAAGAFTVVPGVGSDLGDQFLTWTPINETGPRYLTWDGDGALGDNPSDAPGVWDEGTGNWHDGTAHVTFDESRPDVAVLGTGAATAGHTVVTLDSDMTVGGVLFTAGSNYHVAMGPNNFGVLRVAAGGALVVDQADARIAVPVTRVGDQSWVVGDGGRLTLTRATTGGALTKQGSGTLTLAAGGSFTDLAVQAGVVEFGAAPTIGGQFTIDGGALGVVPGATAVTIAKDVLVGPNGAGAQASAAGQTLTLNGILSGGPVTVRGDGVVVLGNALNTYAGLTVDGGAVRVAADGALGAGPVMLRDGGAVRAGAANLTIAREVVLAGTGGEIDTNGNAVTVRSVAGDAPLTKVGGGTLVVAQHGSAVRTGDTLIDGGTLRFESVDAGGVPTVGSGTIFVNDGGTLELRGVNVGAAGSTAAGTVRLNDGGTVLASGGASAYDGSSPMLVVSEADASVVIRTAAVGDSISLGDGVRDEGGAESHGSTITVDGPGKVILRSGGAGASNGFSGRWVLNAGVLQLGPSAGGGSAVHALGFVGNDVTNGVPIQINGGVLAIGSNRADDAVAEVFADVTLNGGGAIGNVGLASDGGARLGGDLVVAGVASRILVGDVDAPTTPRDVTLTGSAFTSWSGMLTVDPTGSTGGRLTLSRSGGGVNVAPGATVRVLAGATLEDASGNDVFNGGTNQVAIENAGTFAVAGPAGSLHTVGRINGTGTTTVGDGVGLTVAPGTPIAPDTLASRVASEAGELSPTGSAYVDLTNNDLVIRGSDLADGVADSTAAFAAVVSGRGTTGPNATKLHDGPGLRSATARDYNDDIFVDVLGLTAVLNGDLNLAFNSATTTKTTFGGLDVTPDDTLVRFGMIADLNFDGAITAQDYFAVDQGFLGRVLTRTDGSVVTGALTGDLTGDGLVNASDYFLIDQAFLRQGGTPIDAMVEFQRAAFGDAFVAMAFSAPAGAVPEPATLSLLALGATALLGRRRRS